MGNLIDARCPKMTRMDPNHFPYMWIWIFLESCFNRTNGQNICFFLFVMRGWGIMGLLWYGFARFMVWFCGNFQVTFHLSAGKYNRQNQKCGFQALPENFRSYVYLPTLTPAGWKLRSHAGSRLRANFSRLIEKCELLPSCSTQFPKICYLRPM